MSIILFSSRLKLMYQISQTKMLIINNKYLNVYDYNFSQEIKKIMMRLKEKQMTEEIIQEKETRERAGNA